MMTRAGLTPGRGGARFSGSTSGAKGNASRLKPAGACVSRAVDARSGGCSCACACGGSRRTAPTHSGIKVLPHFAQIVASSPLRVRQRWQRIMRSHRFQCLVLVGGSNSPVAWPRMLLIARILVRIQELCQARKDSRAWLAFHFSARCSSSLALASAADDCAHNNCPNSSTRRSPDRRSVSVRVRRSSTCLATEKCASPNAAICGRWVTQRI